MSHPPSPRATIPFPFVGKKRLSSRDRVWLVTDVYCFTDSIFGWSRPQRWFRVGGVCLTSNELAMVEFSNDDVRAMLKAGVVAAPWNAARPFGFEVTRFTHGSQEKGRFREKVELIELPADLIVQGPELRRHFEIKLGLRGNGKAGMWKKMQDAANRENSIEAAAMSFTDWFSAGDVKAIVGDINVTRTLARMVKDLLLVTNGKAKRGVKYMAAPPILVDRSDWNA